MISEEIKKMFRRIEIDKSNDSCGFEFADGFGCTFDNIATCYDDRLKLYDLVKQLQQENNQLKEEYYKQIEEYQKACDEVTSDKMDLENILKELRSWLEEQVFNRGGSSIDLAIEIHTFCKVLDKLNELEGGKND